MKSTDKMVTQAMELWLKEDFLAAEKLLLEAVELGSGHAAHNLGTLYVSGAPCIKVDRKKAIKYYEIALETGFEETISTDPTWFRKY